MPCNCMKKNLKMKKHNDKHQCSKCKKKGFKTHPTKGVKKWVKVPLAMVQTYH